MFVSSIYAQSLCDSNFWKAAQPEDIDQINELDLICMNKDYEGTFNLPIFHVAALYASPEVVQALLDAGAEPDIKSNDGTTALHWAAGIGRSELVQIFFGCWYRP